MARKIDFAAMLLTLIAVACQPTENSADPSGVAMSTEENEASGSPLVGAWRLDAIQEIAADGTTMVFTRFSGQAF